MITQRNARTAIAVNRWWWPVTGAGVAAAWIGVALAHSTRFPPLSAAVAAGTAILAAAPPLPVAGTPGLTGVVALLVLPLAVAEAARGGNAAPLGAVLGVLALLALFADIHERGRSVPLLAMAIGLAGVVTGLTAGSLVADRVRLAIADRPSAAVVLAGAALVLVAVDHRSRAERAVLAPVLLAALLAAPALPPLALILGWGTLAAGSALLHRPTVALGGLAVVATAAGAGPAGLLLATGAVLAAALDARVAAVCGLPGAVVLANLLAGRELTAVSSSTGVVLAVVAVALAFRLGGGARFDGGRPTAWVLAAWLVIAPSTWDFTGAGGLDAYDTGALRALATGGLVALVVLFRRGGEFAWSADVAEPDEGVPAVGHPAVTGTVAALATVVSVGWLVVSVVRLH